MKKHFRLLILLIILFAASATVFGQKQIRVKFAKSATSAVVSGKLNDFKDKKVFVIRVREGQTLNVEQIKSEASMQYVSISIASPTGADASCNSRKEIAPTAAGDYTITVYECQKADEWRGKFKLKISVK